MICWYSLTLLVGSKTCDRSFETVKDKLILFDNEGECCRVCRERADNSSSGRHHSSRSHQAVSVGPGQDLGRTTWHQDKHTAGSLQYVDVKCLFVAVRASLRWRSAPWAWRSCWRPWMLGGSWRCSERGPPASSVLSAASSTKER